ncbi:hypothetical protein [Sphingorhabdus sp. M41]|uniref:hypothetical protein n=1 Tax=Sphingorhabdus sp. M41 TaxID=1806885 RepID=UPI0018D3DA83|nr:hypothetical protein [Sphingorhabdus sp. M41]
MTELIRDRVLWVEIAAFGLKRVKKFHEAVVATSLPKDNEGNSPGIVWHSN